jgi:hypothetical protein
VHKAEKCDLYLPLKKKEELRTEHVNVKLSGYTPWRCLEGEEAQLLLVLDHGTRWG